MADFSAELARFEAELASVSQARPGSGPGASTAAYHHPAAFQYGMQADYSHMNTMYNQAAYASVGNMAYQPGTSGGVMHPAYAAGAPAMSAPAASSFGAAAVAAGAAAAGIGGSKGQAPGKQNDGKKKGALREAAGKRWRDPTLDEWPENDYRIFVGDLGHEVNDEVLGKAFQQYPSFAKAKIVKDKHTKKSKGFGFVSFLDGNDFAKALKEMNGKYIGNRPCKLSKSSWQDRSGKPPAKRSRS